MAPAPLDLPAYGTALVLLGDLVALVATVWLFRAAGARPWPLALGLGSWLVLTLALAWTGVFDLALTDQLPLALVAVVAPLVLAVTALGSRRVRSIARRLDLRWLVGAQIYRAAGGVFLVAMGAGLLPAVFAVPAGWGDILVGLGAPVAALVALKGRGGWWTAAAWNTLGLADLVMAVTLANLAGSPTGNVLGAVPTMEAVTRYPLVLIPAFMVPLSVFLHLVTYVRLGAWTDGETR